MEGPKGLSLLILVGLGVLLAVAVAAGDAEGTTVTVPDDHLTIQSAIENASDYDTLFIRDGTYNESVVVYRPMTIMGESQEGTVISHDDPFALLIVAHKVRLSNVTVQGTTTGAGLILQASYCVIEDVIIRDNLWGLWVNRGHHNTVRDVECLDNEWQGALVEEADHTLLEGVTCSGNNEGIMVRAAIGTTIRGSTMEMNRIHGLSVMRLDGAYENRGLHVVDCTIKENAGSGCDIYHIDEVTVEGCLIADNAWTGIRLDTCNDTVLRNCTVRNFTRFGIAYVGRDLSSGSLIEDNEVEDEGTAWSVVMTRDSDDCIIRNNRITCLNNALSIYSMNDTRVSGNTIIGTNVNASYLSRGLNVGTPANGVGDECYNVTVADCTVRGFTKAIVVDAGKQIGISGCTVTECDGDGILLEANAYGDQPMDGGDITGCTLVGCGINVQGMNDVLVKGNVITSARVGVVLNGTTRSVDGNIFYANIVMDCTEYGLHFIAANGTNDFLLNDFINNTVHSSAPGPGDAFDNGKEGNYWDDYVERYPEAEVVGLVWDTPYAVGTSTVMDRRPLAYRVFHDMVDAEAGEDRTVLAGTLVTLDGSGSTSKDMIATYNWTFTYADTEVHLVGEVTTFPFLLVGQYEVQLETTSVWGDRSFDHVTIDVYDDEDPVSNAGPDIEVPMGEGFTLTGSASTDNGFIVSYEWLIDPEGLDRVGEGEAFGFTISAPGEYPVVLRVTDEAGNWDIDEVLVTVLDTEPPVADAGRDLVADQGDAVTLSGRWSRDNVGVTSWTWTFEEDGQVVIEVGRDVERVFPLAGVYQVFLNVSDGAGNWDVDQMELTVRDTEPPVADAGEDLRVDQGTLVTLDGTGSSDNEGVVAFVWLFAEGSVLKDLLGAGATHRFDAPGEYELELQAWDAAGNVGRDWVIVRVNAVTSTVQWRLGPFVDEDGALGGVRVEVTLNGTAYVAYTDDDGDALFPVAAADLVSPASVVAEKEGWKDLDLSLELDADGDPTGTIPVMKRARGDGDGEDDDDEDETDWLAWGLVIVLMVAYAGTLMYLSAAAKRAEEE